MADAVYAIEDFPDDDLLWRIEWIGGVGYNTSVPSDPQIEICLAQLPAGETNPLSARSRSSQTKRTVRIAVGLLPYISIASVWQQRRPVIKDLAASRHRLCIDTSLCRTVALAELANAIPRSSLTVEAMRSHHNPAPSLSRSLRSTGPGALRACGGRGFAAFLPEPE
jgi:hypothetical protein